MKIILDNGHGKETPGKRSPIWSDGSQLFEWKSNREIAKRVFDALIADGVDVVLLVPEDEDVPLSERARRVNEIAARYGKKNTLLVSIHSNASASGKGTGWEIHTYLGKSKSDEVAEIFWQKANKIFGGTWRIRGDRSDGDGDWDSNFYILRKTICPAVLTENFFMDNEKDCRFLMSDEGKNQIAELHIESIKQYINETNTNLR